MELISLLEFLPNLQEQIEVNTTSHVLKDNSSFVDSKALLISNAQVRPKHTHLKRYCHEIGLASYIWNNSLRHHVERLGKRALLTKVV